MNKRILIALGFVGLIAVVIYVQASTQPQSPKSTQLTSTQTVDTKTQGQLSDDRTSLSSPTQDSRYVPYTQQAFESAKDKKRVLYFHAPWCPTCRPLDAALTKDPNQIPEGVILLKTDYDTETALKTKYAVTYQHTFVEVDGQGNAVKTWNGGDVADIVSKLL